MIQTNYQPTFVEKILGRNYKWWYAMMHEFKSRTASLFDNAFFVFGNLLIVLGTMVTWWLANNKVIDVDLEQKWVYFLVGELFLSLSYTFSEYIGFDIIAGRHVRHLLRPASFIKTMLFVSYGESLAQNLIKSSILSIIFLIFISLGIATFSFPSLIALILLPFSLFIIFISGFITACSGFYLPRMHGVAMNYTFLSALLMGRVFPLNLIYENFIFYLFNPFAFTFYHPMQIYLGNYNTNQTILVFLGGLAWCIILYFLAKFVFKAGLNRNESVWL